MIQNKQFLITYKVLFALLGFSAIVTEMVTLIERGVFKIENFFSYFTIETNILVVITLLLSAFAVSAGKKDKLDILRSATTVYILVVGIGFAALLSQVEGLTLTAVPWDNIVLHYIIPVAVLIDFLVDRPKLVVSLKKALLWLLFPLIYIIYALTRGALTGWYPYPFLDATKSSWISVTATIVGLFLLGIILIFGVVRMTRRRS